jgi:hypothetical protein
MNAMSEVKFDLKPVDSKPSRRYRKGSKYDPILDAFMEGTNALAAVEVPDKDGNYLRTQLNKRIEAKGLDGIKVSVVNNVCYLEKE